MNWMEMSIIVPAKRSEENPRAESGAPKEIQSHSQLEQMWVILYARPSGPARKQVGMVPGALRKASESIERYGPQEWEKAKKHFRVPAFSGMKAGDLEDLGILVGEVYDEKIIEEMLAQGAGSYSEES